MNVVKCINGHYYDSSRFAVCPFCQEREFVPKTQYKREDSEIVLREAQKSKKITAAVKIRIVTWICYTVGLSILPTIIYVLIDSLFGVGLSDLDKFIYQTATDEDIKNFEENTENSEISEVACGAINDKNREITKDIVAKDNLGDDNTIN